MSISAFQPFFLVFFIVLGFLVLYIFKNVLLVEIKSSFEFYYLSIVSSLFIYSITILLYGISIQQIVDLNDLISKIADINFLALTLISTLIVISIYYLLYISKLSSCLRRHLGTEKGIEITPHGEVWEQVLKKASYIVVLTKDGNRYYGYHKHYSLKGERMLLLCNPDIILDDFTQEPVKNELGLPIKSIMFFEKDIKRIYIVEAKNKATKNKGKRVFMRNF